MYLKLDVIKLSNDDVIATSGGAASDGYGCSFDGKKSYELTKSGSYYKISICDESQGYELDFAGQTPKIGTYYHIWPDDDNPYKITLTECDNPNHQ